MVYVFTTLSMIKMYYVILLSPIAAGHYESTASHNPRLQPADCQHKKKLRQQFRTKRWEQIRTCQRPQLWFWQEHKAIAVHHKSFVPLFPGKLFIDLPSAGRHYGNGLCGTHLSINRPIKSTYFPWTDIDEPMLKVDVIQTGSFTINMLILFHYLGYKMS